MMWIILVSDAYAEAGTAKEDEVLDDDADEAEDSGLAVSSNTEVSALYSSSESFRLSRLSHLHCPCAPHFLSLTTNTPPSVVHVRCRRLDLMLGREASNDTEKS